MLARRLLAGLAAVAGLAAPAAACPFCSSQGQTLAGAVAQADFIVCPTAPTPPPLLEDVARQTPLDSYMNDVFTVPASLAGLPAISVPMDIPVDPAKEEEKLLHFGGLQLIGQYWDDARLLAVAEAVSGHVSQQARREL